MMWQNHFPDGIFPSVTISFPSALCGINAIFPPKALPFSYGCFINRSAALCNLGHKSEYLAQISRKQIINLQFRPEMVKIVGEPEAVDETKQVREQLEIWGNLKSGMAIIAPPNEKADNNL